MLPRIYNKIFLSLVVWQLVKYYHIKVLINEISLSLHIFENYFAPTRLYNKIFLFLVVWQLVKYYRMKILIHEKSFSLHIFGSYFPLTRRCY